MNFPVNALPVDPGVRAEDEALSLHLIPYSGRLSTLLLVLAPRRLLRGALQIRIEGSERVEIRLLDRNSAEFFLDEDPMTCVVRGTGRILDEPEKYRNVLTT